MRRIGTMPHFLFALASSFLSFFAGIDCDAQFTANPGIQYCEQLWRRWGEQGLLLEADHECGDVAGCLLFLCVSFAGNAPGSLLRKPAPESVRRTLSGSGLIFEHTERRWYCITSGRPGALRATRSSRASSIGNSSMQQ